MSRSLRLYFEDIIIAGESILLRSKNIRILFEEKISASKSIVQNFIEQNQKLKEARDSLLPRLMNGSLEV